MFREHEHKWEEVARYVREGCDDPQFLFVLYRMLDPRKDFRNIRFKEKHLWGRPPIPKDLDGVHVLIRLLYDEKRSTRALELIAGEIKNNGLKDVLLRENLADMFSRIADGPLDMKFQIDRTGQSGIHSARKVDLMNFLEIHADLFKSGVAKTYSAASAIFGVSEDTAKKYRKERKKAHEGDEFWSEDFERDVAYVMREHGYPEYQPLEEIKKNIDSYPLSKRETIWDI